MEKISKLRGIRVEVLENQEMKRIVGGNGSGTGSGGNSGSGSISYQCVDEYGTLISFMKANSLEDCNTECRRGGYSKNKCEVY